MVEQQAEPGLELIIGGRTDPAFGKVLTFGMGGTMVELMKDITLRILPVTEDEIRQMVREINGYPLIASYRGARPRDEEALIQIIANVSRFFLENDHIVEFDINPLRLYESGACAVDARVIVTETVHEVEHKERVPVPIEYFTPRSIAVIGASQDSSKMGYAVMHNLLHFPDSCTRSTTSVRRSRDSRHTPRLPPSLPRSISPSSRSRPSMSRPLSRSAGQRVYPWSSSSPPGSRRWATRARHSRTGSWQSRKGTGHG